MDSVRAKMPGGLTIWPGPRNCENNKVGEIIAFFLFVDRPERADMAANILTIYPAKGPGPSHVFGHEMGQWCVVYGQTYPAEM